MEVDDIMKTAVTTFFGQFGLVRMPFGVSNAVQIFQRFMHEFTSGLQYV